MRRWALALLLLLVVAGPAPAESPVRRSSTWVPYWDTAVASQRVLANADLFHTVSPFWFRASSCGSVESNPGAGDAGLVADLRGRGVAVVPTITSTMLPDTAVACLGDAGARAGHVARLRALAGPYDGLEVNYEHLALTTDPAVGARVREAYSAFAADLCAGLRADGRRCVHTVMPRTHDGWEVWRGRLLPAVYDYRAVGAVADRVRVMAYDQHAGSYGPGPIAGWPWAVAVADYAAATLPAGRGELGIPLYGRDWSGGRATVVTAPRAAELARQHGADVRWDDVQRSPVFEYVSSGARHVAWYSDTRSVTERVALARSRGLDAAYWVPSQEDPATWASVRAYAGARFWDTVGGEVQRAVEAVAARGIAQGRADGSFGPRQPVTRGQMASFLTRALALAPSEAPPPEDARASVHAAAVASVLEAGIATGFPDGTFRPDEVVSRGQMASFLRRGLGLAECTPAPFGDVAGSPHEGSVCAVAARGVAQGFPDGTYRPGDGVVRGQMAVFLARALGA